MPDESSSAFQPLEMGKVAILVDHFKNDERPWSQHTALPMPPSNCETAVLMVDGVGSSSAGLRVGRLVHQIDDAGFNPCVFSYRGIISHFYQPSDTVHAKFDDLVHHLDEYVEYYSHVRCLVLVGYSFGGVVVSEWLYRREDSLKALPGFKGVCLIASPVRVQATRVRYARPYERLSQARGYIQSMLDGYTTRPEQLPSITSMISIFCGHDGLLDDDAYSFDDRPLEDRPIQLRLPYTHDDIVRQPALGERVLEALNALCTGIPPAGAGWEMIR